MCNISQSKIPNVPFRSAVDTVGRAVRGTCPQWAEQAKNHCKSCNDALILLNFFDVALTHRIPRD